MSEFRDFAQTVDNDDWCSSCLKHDEPLLCCEGCPRSFHLLCVDPPLSSVPQGQWLCRKCLSIGVSPSKNKEGKRTMWSPLLSAIRSENPRTFFLPFHISLEANTQQAKNRANDVNYCSDNKIPSYVVSCEYCSRSFDTSESIQFAVFEQSVERETCVSCGQQALYHFECYEEVKNVRFLNDNSPKKNGTESTLEFLCKTCSNNLKELQNCEEAFPSVTRTAPVEAILNVRKAETGDLEWLVKWAGLEWQDNSWVSTSQIVLSPAQLFDFVQSDFFKYLVEVAWRDSEFSFYNVFPQICHKQQTRKTTRQIIPPNLKMNGTPQNMVSASMNTEYGRKLIYRFPNGSPFGITQWPDLLNNEELFWLEERCNMLIRKERKQRLKPNTTDKTKDNARTKFFLGYRYDYGNHKKPALHQDVDRLDSKYASWVKDLANLLVSRQVMPPDFLDCVVINIYHRPGSGLGVHMDSNALFHRPIFSVRLFSDSVLSFGCRGPGMTDRRVAIPLPRGCVTMMEGFAANCITHCIRPSDTRSKSASILLRKVKLDLLVPDPTNPTRDENKAPTPNVEPVLQKDVEAKPRPSKFVKCKAPSRAKSHSTRPATPVSTPISTPVPSPPLEKSGSYSPKPDSPLLSPILSPQPSRFVEKAEVLSPPESFFSPPCTPPNSTQNSPQDLSPQETNHPRPKRTRKNNIFQEAFPFVNW